MSDIPKAREMLTDILTDLSVMRSRVRRTLALMDRAPPVRKAPAVPQPITPKIRREVRRLADLHPNLTEHQLAERVGLRNAGRISEILNAK